MFPIHQTAPGPGFMEPAVIKNDPRLLGKDREYMTHNPIKEGSVISVIHKGETVKFRVNMNFYSDPRLVVMEVIK